MDYTANELMRVSQVLPLTGGDKIVKEVFDACGVLSRKTAPTLDLPGVVRAMSEAREDQEIMDVFIVRCHDRTPKKFSTVRDFDFAGRAGNEQAIAAKKRSYQEIQESMGWSPEHINCLKARVRSYIHQTIQESADNEMTIATLRSEGGQVSTILADALEYEYYRAARSFVDAGGAYRKLPSNTKVALIVDQDVLDWMMADVRYDYSTVRELESIGLGVNDFNDKYPFEEGAWRTSCMRNSDWRDNPGKELKKALLSFAENNLQATPVERFTKPESDSQEDGGQAESREE